MRGVVLHKLMEELITGELCEDHVAAVSRAELLLKQLAPIPLNGNTLDAEEMANAALRTLRIDEIRSLRDRLPAKVPSYGMALTRPAGNDSGSGGCGSGMRRRQQDRIRLEERYSTEGGGQCIV
jgi:CRISPR-associated exonuclease Cas4